MIGSGWCPTGFADPPHPEATQKEATGARARSMTRRRWSDPPVQPWRVTATPRGIPQVPLRMAPVFGNSPAAPKRERHDCRWAGRAPIAQDFPKAPGPAREWRNNTSGSGQIHWQV